MPKVCPITGKRPLVGNKVSHANNKTKRRWEPNMQKKCFWIASQQRWIRCRVSVRGMRTIDKYGIEAFLQNSKLINEFILEE